MEKITRQIPTAISTQKPFEIPNSGEGRPWGMFTNLAKGGRWNVKILQIEASKRLSLQSHAKREECMMLLDGDAQLYFEEEGNQIWVQMHQNEMFKIGVGTKHRLASVNGARVIEIAYGEFDESDITRYEDDFGRTA